MELWLYFSNSICLLWKNMTICYNGFFFSLKPCDNLTIHKQKKLSIVLVPSKEVYQFLFTIKFKILGDQVRFKELYYEVHSEFEILTAC